jgi:hypothetical protein
VKVSHAPSALSASFDDPNLVSCAGLVPVLEFAQRCGLADLVGQRVTVPGANGPVKITAPVAGMVAGADSIADLDLLRHGAMGRLFTGVRAPSTLGTFLRSFRFGHVRQLDAVAAAVLARLAGAVPLLPGCGRGRLHRCRRHPQADPGRSPTCPPRRSMRTSRGWHWPRSRST